ncbi:MAG: homoserine dehydrogenase [Promethearchaeota archaeon]
MELKICLIGKGNVGTCFIQLLKKKKEIIRELYNCNCKLVAVFEFDGALINENGINLDELSTNNNFKKSEFWKKSLKAIDLIPKLNIDICIDTTPTNPNTGEPALTHILEALNNNIDVISSNKAPFFLQYKRIKNLADKKKCFIKYEATVASCVPALSIKNNLIGNTIIRIKAILNGTNNYILSRMTSERIPFEVALKEAQELGYAETDPSLDVGGYDTAGKLVILANELLGWSKSIKDVKIEGITKITLNALELAKLDGYVIKHLAIAEENNLIVEPRLVRRDSPLNIGGILNLIELQTKYAGPIILMGKGAGGFEAASAILNDLINIIKERNKINRILIDNL